MELVQVKIKGTVITAQYGSLSDGDLLRCSPEFAKHLVDDCNAADHIKAQEKEVPDITTEVQKPAAKKSKG